MLATRVIPTLLYRGDQLVKGKHFDGWRSVGHVRQAVAIHAARQVDELIVLDIGATPEGRGPDIARVRKLTELAFTPITVGGGITTPQQIATLLASGADKVSICSALNTDLLTVASAQFGRQAITAAIDARDHNVWVRCGKVPLIGPVGPVNGRSSWPHVANMPALNWAKVVEEEGAGEILLTSIDREGTMEGYDLDLIHAVASAVSIPVIAHGGCSGYEDMVKAVQAGASAVAAGALFQFTDCTPAGAAAYLLEHGIEARVHA